MPDLIITDAAVLFPDGTVRGGQTIEIKDGIIQSVREAKESDWELPAKEHFRQGANWSCRGLRTAHAYRAAAPERQGAGRPSDDLDADHAAL